MRSIIVTALLLVATPSFAASVHCVNPDASVTIDVDFTFAEGEEFGTATAVRAVTEHMTLSTFAGENGTETPETLAFGDVVSDRLQVGLESANFGPMSMTLDIVRTFEAQPGDPPEAGVKIAGVAYLASAGTMTLVCTGW